MHNQKWVEPSISVLTQPVGEDARSHRFNLWMIWFILCKVFTTNDLPVPGFPSIKQIVNLETDCFHYWETQQKNIDKVNCDI